MTEPDPNVAAAAGPGSEAGPASPGGAARAAWTTGHTVPALALLPLRLFLGATYLYAGIDKFLSPDFLSSSGPFSVAGQMEAYLRSSPLAPLVEAALPIAVPIGVLIALAEIAIGIGLLTGLAYRVAAWAGFGLSILFWLTASWSITPYYFSPDLPYAFGFLALALAGHGHLLVVDPWPSRRGSGPADAPPDDAAAAGAASVGTAPGDAVPGEAPAGGGGSRAAASPARRQLLQVGIVAALTLLTAGAVSRLRAFGASEAAGGASGTPAPTAAPSPGPTAAPTADLPDPTPALTAAPTIAAATAQPSPAPTAAATPAPTPVGVTGPVIASVTDLAPNGGLPFTVPNEVPFAQGPGGPGVLVELADGRFVAYSAVCTHGRCTVVFDPSVSELVCPCHAGRFDPANAAAVLGGPPPLPLPAIPVAVDGSGQVHVVLEG